MDGERRYSDKEVEAILAKAVELSRRERGPAAHGDGTSLPELERIATEAGLSAETVRRAASELERPKSWQSSGLRHFFRAEAATREIALTRKPDHGALARLLAVLPDILKASGSGQVVEGGLVWRGSAGTPERRGMGFRVEVSSAEQGGWVLATVDTASAAGGLYGGIVGGLGGGCGLGVGLGVGLGALGSTPFAVAVPIVCLGLSFFLARGIMGLVSRWAERRVREIADEIAKRL
jgi:hypothetical protein